MTLIPQTKTKACWYASAQMLVKWRRETTQYTDSAIIDPSEDNSSKNLWEVNGGLTNPMIIDFATRLGLEAVPPQSPSEDGIAFMLRTYGPLWVNGKTHIVVMAGIRNEGSGEGEVYIYNPWNNGSKTWQSLSAWYVGKSASSGDTSNSVQAVFLHCPAF